MAVAFGLMSFCCLLSSTGLSISYSLGVIPGTGPHLIKESGLENIKKYVPLVDKFEIQLADYENAETPEKLVKLDKFITDNEKELKNICADTDKMLKFAESLKSEEVFTLSGMKETNEFTIEYLKTDEDFMGRLERLYKFNKCV